MLFSSKHLARVPLTQALDPSIHMPSSNSVVTFPEILNESVSDRRFENVHIETNFFGSTFSHVAFVKCRLDRVLMRKTIWTDCDFANCKLTIDFNDSHFERCSFHGTLFRGLDGQYGGVRAKFISCDFTDAVLQSLNLRACRFTDCTFSGTRLSNCDLRGAKHNDVPLENSL